jgi:hypothetical protein
VTPCAGGSRGTRIEAFPASRRPRKVCSEKKNGDRKGGGSEVRLDKTKTVDNSFLHGPLLCQFQQGQRQFNKLKAQWIDSCKYRDWCG